MIVSACQRWRDQRASYRPAREVIDTRAYEVAAMDDDTTPKAFVCQHHYAGTYPSARFRFGLYARGGALVGVAVFSHPVNDAVFHGLPGERGEAVELGRLVLLDNVLANAESWFVAQCFAGLRRQGLVSVVSFSDPEARTSLAGEVVFPGHLGTIYQALNATYVGLATPRTLRLLPDGRTFNDRAAQKVRAQERGWRYAVAQLEAHGAASLTTNDDPPAWLATWTSRLTRPLRHHGNHKYVWAVDPRARKHLPKGQPYPKVLVPQLSLALGAA